MGLNFALAAILVLSAAVGFSAAGGAHTSLAASPAAKALANCKGAREGGNLTFGIPQDVIGFDPTNTQDVISLSVQLQIFDQLLRYAPNAKKVSGGVAQSWKVSKSGTVWTFNLRHNARFSNGKAVTAADVVASYKFLERPTAVVNWTLADMKSVKALNKHTVRLTLKKANAPFSTDLTLWGASIFPAKVLKKEGAAGFRLHPVGSGPFYLAKWVPGSYILLKKNKYYWGKDACGHKLPYVNSVKLQIVPDDNTRVIKLESGSLDSMINIPYNEVGAVNHAAGTHAAVTDAGNCINYPLNTHFAPFRDLHVTQAMNYAINRNAIVKAVFFGAAEPALSMSAKGSLFYTGKYGYHYSLKKAKALMKKSKFPKGFSVKLETVAGSSSNAEIATIIQSELKKIGITMSVEPLDATSEFSSIKAESYQMATINCTQQSVDPDTNMLFCCVSWGGAHANYTSWHNAKSDAVFAKTETALNPKQRGKYYAQFQKLVMANGPIMWIVNPSNTFGYRSNVHGFTVDFTAHWDLWTVWKK
jgi:peptide/nickel transport system substrate-binding protein